MLRTVFLLAFVLATGLTAEVRKHTGGKRLPHEDYIRVVSQQDSPVERAYIATKDGLYVAAAIRKPAGPGPFPVLLHFHGAPGGRKMERLVNWSLGTTGGPLWERFLREGYAVVVADYRNHPQPVAIREDDSAATYVDDGMAVLQWVRQQPYVDSSRITLYGVSRGGGLVLEMLRRTSVASAVLGAPAIPAAFQEKEYVKPISTRILLLVGTKDQLLSADEKFYAVMESASHGIRMDVFENGYHDFVLGPQGHALRDEPLMDITLEALELTLDWVKGQP